MDSLLIEKDEQAQLGKYIDEAHLGISEFNKNDQNCTIDQNSTCGFTSSTKCNEFVICFLFLNFYFRFINSENCAIIDKSLQIYFRPDGVQEPKVI